MPNSPFQTKVAQFVDQNNLEIPIADRMLDLSSEIGELAKEILKSTQYGRQDFQPTEAWADELGDVFFALICLANTTDINLLGALDRALNKYQARLNTRGEAGSSNL